MSVFDYDNLILGEKVFGLEFSHRMGLSQSRGSRVISRMLKSGYIKLETVQGDRRAVAASLTSKGISMRKRLEDRMGECEKRINSQLDAQTSQEIRNTLEKLITVM